MPRIASHKGYASTSSTPKPKKRVQPHVLTVRDGIPLRYANCDGVGVRVVHPSNPKAPSRNMSLAMLYLPPHASLGVSSHETEECYTILRGQGTMTLAGKKVEVRAGTFIHLPSWCEHGVENTGDETLEILICTAPPNP